MIMCIITVFIGEKRGCRFCMKSIIHLLKAPAILAKWRGLTVRRDSSSQQKDLN